MGKVTTGGTMSLDGYIAGPEESGFDLLFQWYGNGDVEIPSASADVPPPRISAASAELIKPEWENTGALVVGRHLSDMTNAWGGRHPMNVTTVVLTHRRPDDRPEDDENFVFVTDGIEAAVAKAKELAGDKNVAVNGGQMARLCLEAGLLDEVGVELVPVVLGGGTPLRGPSRWSKAPASRTCATGSRSKPPTSGAPGPPSSPGNQASVAGSAYPTADDLALRGRTVAGHPYRDRRTGFGKAHRSAHPVRSRGGSAASGRAGPIGGASRAALVPCRPLSRLPCHSPTARGSMPRS